MAFELENAHFPPLTIPCEDCNRLGYFPAGRDYNGAYDQQVCGYCKGVGSRDNRDAVILALAERLKELEDRVNDIERPGYHE